MLPDEHNGYDIKLVAYGMWIEQCVRDGRYDLIPPGTYIPPRWLVEDTGDA